MFGFEYVNRFWYPRNVFITVSSLLVETLVRELNDVDNSLGLRKEPNLSCLSRVNN